MCRENLQNSACHSCNALTITYKHNNRSFKAVVRTPRKGGFYQVYIRVTHRRVHGYIKTDKVVSRQMIDKYGNIVEPFVNEYCTRLF